jgi:hypothetical protein
MTRVLTSIAIGLLAVGCSHARSLPEPDGEAFDEGMYAFARQQEDVRQTRELEPWSPGFFYPTLAQPAAQLEGERTTIIPSGSAHSTADGPVHAAAWLWYRGYKNTLSKVDGNSCRFYPSCSTFGLQAVRSHGLYGVAMTFGRLHKNHQDARHYPMIRPPFLDDPVANYGFWLRAPRLDGFADYDNPAHGWYQHLRAVEHLAY